MPNLSPEDSKRITSLRFLLAVFVVFIHNCLDVESAMYYHLAFDEPTFITYLKTFMTSTLGGAAVPLFFLFSGYLQFRKQDSYPVLLKKRLKSLVVPYVLWTLLAVLLFFVGQRIFRSCRHFFRMKAISCANGDYPTGSAFFGFIYRMAKTYRL